MKSSQSPRPFHSILFFFFFFNALNLVKLVSVFVAQVVHAHPAEPGSSGKSRAGVPGGGSEAHPPPSPAAAYVPTPCKAEPLWEALSTGKWRLPPAAGPAADPQPFPGARRRGQPPAAPELGPADAGHEVWRLS